MMQGANQFGGFWTEIKLEVVVDYLKLYTKALRPQGFRLWYIDAFAGSGEREEVRRERGLLGQPDEIRKEVFDGSAKLALAVQPPFDGLIFIEKQKRSQSSSSMKCSRLYGAWASSDDYPPRSHARIHDDTERTAQ